MAKTDRPRAANGRYTSSIKDEVALLLDYRANVLTIAELAIKHGTSASSVNRLVAKRGEPPRSPRKIDPANMLQRMLMQIENEMNKLAKIETFSSTHSAVLQRLCTTLDKVIAMRDAEEKRPGPRAETRELKALRAKLLARVKELSRE